MFFVAEISPEGWALIITALGAAVVTPIINLILTLRQNKKADADRKEVKEDLAIQNQVSARKVEEVKNTLSDVAINTDEKLAGLASVAEKTHTLVNSNMGTALKLNATLARRLATMTNDPLDAQVADAAEKLLGEHESKQRIVDEGHAIAGHRS